MKNPKLKTYFSKKVQNNCNFYGKYTEMRVQNEIYLKELAKSAIINALKKKGFL